MKQFLIKNSVFIFAFCCFAFCHAQRYSFRNYTVAQGLGSSSVNHIFQDSKGYLWFATQGGGASRFNGKEFKNYTRADGLISNDVTYITEDNTGNIWIGTAEGASVFDGNRFTGYNQSKGLTGGVVYCIYTGAENKIWFATEDAGVKTFDGKKFDNLTGIPTGEVYTIAADKHGNLYFGLADGIAKYSNGKTVPVALPEYKLNGKSFFSSITDAGGNIWFGSMTGDVLTIHTDNRIEKVELPPSLNNDFIGSMEQDINGNLWLATDHGLLKLSPPVPGGLPEGRSAKLFSQREGLSVNTVQAVRCDYEGNIWAGTLSGGVNLLSSEAFINYTGKGGLASTDVTAICPAPNGTSYYTGTGGGLYVFTPSAELPFGKVNAVEKINISSLAVDNKKQLWISAQEGVFVLQQKGQTLQLTKQYRQIAGERVISPLKIIHDTKGNTWIATYGSGVFCINGSLEKCYNTKTGFASDKALTVFEDSQGNIWIGTLDEGAIKYDGANFSPPVSGGLPKGQGDNETAVWSITEDNTGTIFFGTGESGILRYNGKTTTGFSTKDGLASNYITAMQWDKKEKCLWVGSEKGLDKLAFTEDQKLLNIHAYKETEGFKSTGINHNSILLNAEGQVYMGTVNGLWLFTTKNHFPKIFSPKIQLTGIRLHYQKTDWKKHSGSFDTRSGLPLNLKLPHNKNHLTFDIQALTTADVLYTYILQGQDKEWSVPTKNNEITYSNISPGSYTFKARAVSSHGTVSNETVSFPLVVNPPWWNTWWFYLLTATVIVTGFFFFVKARERLLREQNVKLEATVKQRTEVIEQQKQTVEKMLGEKEVLLKEIHHRVKNNLQTISSMLMLQSAGLKDEEAKKAITESQSRVRSIALVHQKLYQTDGLEKVELEAFVKDLTAQVQSLYHRQSNHVTVQQNIPTTYLLIDKAIPLGLILNELFTNSFKYAFSATGKGTIDVTLLPVATTGKTRKVKLIYRDSGPELSSAHELENASTLGLRLIKLLSQQIGAELNYSNINGSEFIFTFSINI